MTFDVPILQQGEPFFWGGVISPRSERVSSALILASSVGEGLQTQAQGLCRSSLGNFGENSTQRGRPVLPRWWVTGNLQRGQLAPVPSIPSLVSVCPGICSPRSPAIALLQTDCSTRWLRHGSRAASPRCDSPLMPSPGSGRGASLPLRSSCFSPHPPYADNAFSSQCCWKFWGDSGDIAEQGLTEA